MNREDAAKVVATLFASYSHMQFTRANVEAYISGIIDLDAAAASLATERLRKGAKFPPAISEFREVCAAIVLGPRKTGNEAYAEMHAAREKHGRYPAVWFVGDEMRTQKPWPPVAPDIAAAVRQTWGSWEACCADSEIESPSRARFIQAYDGLSERERADLVSGVPLPPAGTAAPRLAEPQTSPSVATPPKTQPRAIQAQAIAEPKRNTVINIPMAPHREKPGPTPFQGRKVSVEELEAELAKRGAK